MSDPFDDLLAGGEEFLAGFNRRGRFSGSNCPATAGAVHAYFESGERQAAPPAMAGDGFQNMGEQFRTARLPAILRILRQGGHGTFLVVGAHASGNRQHYVNLVNIRGTLYYVDAYTRPPILQTDIAARLRWAERLEYTRRFVPRFLPQGSAPREVIVDN
jgi:hypothetical protein